MRTWLLALLLLAGQAWADDSPEDGAPESSEPALTLAEMFTSSASANTPEAWMAEGWSRKTDGDREGAVDAFLAALEAKPSEAQGQTCHIELGWLERDLGHPAEARAHFQEARRGPDKDQAKVARGELRYLPRPIWGNVYGEAFGYARVLPEESANLVPTVRLRVHFHPFDKVDFDPYLFLQITRDVASRGVGSLGFPLIYADNTMMFGGGVQLRLWKRHIGLFAQAGAAVKLIDDGSAPIQFDARIGAWFDLSSPRCSVPAAMVAPGARLTFEPCAETYDEIVYVSRFSNDVVGAFRGRLAFTWMVTGPFAWQVIGEGRLLLGAMPYYWNNLVDLGIGHRWRLLTPFGFDLMLGVHPGAWLPRNDIRDEPEPPRFLDFRLQAALYVEF